MVDNTAIKVQTWSASLHWYSSVHFPQLAAGAPKKISRHHYGTSGNECRHHAGWRTAFAVLLTWENIICSELSCPRNIADFFFFLGFYSTQRGMSEFRLACLQSSTVFCHNMPGSTDLEKDAVRENVKKTEKV